MRGRAPLHLPEESPVGGWVACACSRKSVKRTHSGGPHIHGWHTFHQASPCRPPRNFHPKWRVIHTWPTAWKISSGVACVRRGGPMPPGQAAPSEMARAMLIAPCEYCVEASRRGLSEPLPGPQGTEGVRTRLGCRRRRIVLPGGLMAGHTADSRQAEPRGRRVRSATGENGRRTAKHSAVGGVQVITRTADRRPGAPG